MLLYLRCWLDRYRLSKDPENKQLRGRWGESHALRFLKIRDYRLVVRNWRCGSYEIDSVFWKGPVLVFVEVRTCHADSEQGGVYSVDFQKKQALKRACILFLNNMPQRAVHTRFDIVEVRYKGLKPITIRHYAGVPLLG